MKHINLIIKILIVLIIIVVIVFVSFACRKTNSDIAKLSDKIIFWPKVTQDEKNVYYFKNSEDPGLYKMDIENKEEEKISETLDTPDLILWSPDFQNALIFITYNKTNMERYGSPFIDYATPDQTQIKWVFNIQTKKLHKLSNYIINVDWLSENNLVYQYQKDGISSIQTSDYYGQNIQVIYDLGNMYVDKFVSVNENKLYFMATPGEGISYLYILDLANNDLIKSIADIDLSYDISIVESGDASYVAYIKDFNGTKTLSWMNISTQEINTIETNSDINKFAWLDQNNLVYTISEEKTDTLYTYEITSLKKQKLISKIDKKTPLRVDSFQPFSTKNSYLVFNNNLYKLDLK